MKLRELTVVLVVTAMLQYASAQAMTHDEAPADTPSVRALWAQLDEFWDTRNADGFSRLFSDDASFGFVDRAEVLEGRTTIHQHYDERFRALSPDLRHRTVVRDVHHITDDVVAVDGTVEVLRSDAERVDGEVLLTFAIFAIMMQADGELRIRELRAYAL